MCEQVDDTDPMPHARRPLLHTELQRMTGRACPACDAEGAAAKPFPSIKELRTHVERVHRKRLCVVCAHVSAALDCFGSFASTPVVVNDHRSCELHVYR